MAQCSRALLSCPDPDPSPDVDSNPDPSPSSILHCAVAPQALLSYAFVRSNPWHDPAAETAAAIDAHDVSESYGRSIQRDDGDGISANNILIEVNYN